MNVSEGAEVLIVSRTGRPGAEPRTRRIEVRVVVSCESESNFYAGFSESVSECGVFVATQVPLGVGSAVELWISLPHKEPICARGTVRWQRAYSESNGTIAGMGIRFDYLSAEATARLYEFAQARAPMFFDDESTDTS
jgi:uncharacterized protein (TIGR02266 family)